MYKILIVDDSEFTRQTIEKALNANFNVKVSKATNGLDAVDSFKKLRQDLIILNIVMPIMDGIEALKYIKRLDSNVKVIMCSAMSQEKYVIEALKLGANDFIIKPFKTERLISAVRKLMGGKEDE